MTEYDDIQDRFRQCLLELAQTLSPAVAIDAASAVMAGACQALVEIATDDPTGQDARSIIKESLIASTPLAADLFVVFH